MDNQIIDREVTDRERYKIDNSIIHKERCKHFKCISWSAILSGALVGIGISFIFNLFAMAIGLTAFVTTSATPNTIAVGGLVSLLLITIFSMGTAGWVAGYLGRPRSLHRDLGVIYGFTTWCVALVLGVLLATSFGKFITYNVAALQNPTYLLTNVDNTANASTTSATSMTNPQTATTTNQTQVSTQDAAKALAASTFLLFVFAFIGGIASCIGGHWGFRSSERDILYYKDNNPRI